MTSKYNQFRNRMSRRGESRPERVLNHSKRTIERRILNSPTLSHIEIVDVGKDIPSIISHDEKLQKKRFLFVPDTKVETGWLIKSRGSTFLSLIKTDDPLYPQVFCELCNHDFIIKDTQRVMVGKNELGRPIYETITTEINVPSVSYTNVYSTLGNSTLSLPSGAMVLRIPFKPEYLDLIKKNDEYSMNTGTYIVTEVSRQYVINDEEGFLEISLQRKVE